MTDGQTPPQHPGSSGENGFTPGPLHAGRSLGALLGRLLEDARDLIRQEIALAKSELTAAAGAIARSGGLIAAGAVLLLIGFVVLTVFVVIALGELLGDRYWLSTLIVGALFAGAGGLLVLRGKKGLQVDNLKPVASLASVNEDTRWLRSEIRELKEDVTSPVTPER